MVKLRESSTNTRLGYVIVLRRISDYGYITAPLLSPFTTRWGYGVCILDLNPRRPLGGTHSEGNANLICIDIYYHGDVQL